MSSELFDRHRAMLELVLRALATRDAFSAYAANPADYNEILAAEGRTAFANYCNSYFYLDQPGPAERTGEESSPYGLTMGIQYPKANLNAVLPAASRAKDAWSRESPDVRAGVCMEILHQLNTRSFEIALPRCIRQGRRSTSHFVTAARMHRSAAWKPWPSATRNL